MTKHGDGAADMRHDRTLHISRLATIAIAFMLAFSAAFLVAPPSTADAALTAGRSASHHKTSIAHAAVKYAHSTACTGGQIKPRITVKYHGKKLRRGKDYTLTYANNVNPGTADIVIAGKGKYSGKTVKHFTIRERKIVMIGNSSAFKYGKVGSRNRVNTPWPELTAIKLGLDDAQWTVYRKYASCIARKHCTWASLLKRAPKDASVTDVIILGGPSADNRSAAKSVKKGYKAFVKLLRKKFPNARIAHTAVLGIKQKIAYQLRVYQKLKIYKSCARKNHVYWLSGCQKVLRFAGLKYVRTSDHRHPNQKGTELITRRLIHELNKLDRTNRW